MKRLLDIAISATALVALSPVIAATAVAVRWTMGGPVVFRQQRPGLNGEAFEMMKFRSMRDAVDADGNPLADAERLTRTGDFIRKTSLDELPGLINVLRGDMSLVGPRPLLMEYLPLYSTRQMRRHDVKPGITGWAQVNGRNALSWDEKFELDLHYVEHRSLSFDLRILWMTLRKVLVRDGISAAGEATMSKFTGQKTETTNA
nr:sugar transferase [Ahrensia sp. R2A130]